jgi:hypothetical protein
MQRGRKKTARVTVWWPKQPLTTSWTCPGIAMVCFRYYEYDVGVPATIEYRQ